MDKIKVNAQIVDKHKIYSARGKYDPETRFLEVRRGLRREILRFIVDPDHLYEMVRHGRSRGRYTVFLDNAKRRSIELKQVKETIENGVKKTEVEVKNVNVNGESIKLHNDDDIDLELANKLDYHTERGFWRALLQSHKIPTTTLLITMFAGYGILRFVEWILSAALHH